MMQSKTTKVLTGGLAILAAIGVLSVTGSAGTRQTPSTIPGDGLTLAHLQWLPDTQVIESPDGRITAAELKAMRVTEARAAEAALWSAVDRTSRKLRALQSGLAQEEQRLIDESARAVKAALERARRRDALIQKIRPEVAEMYKRVMTATAAQRNELDRRAAELLRELRAVGVR